MTHPIHPGTARTRRAVRAAYAALLFGAVLALASCAPKVTQVDSSYTMPEGTPSSGATLVVWREQPMTAYLYEIQNADTLFVRTVTKTRYPAGTLHGLVFDHTQADAYQAFRRESGGGVRQFMNVNADRTRQYLQSEYETYHFVDSSPSGYTPSTYIGRGVVEGVVNQLSPLTNLGVPASLENIDVGARWLAHTGTTDARSRIAIHWDHPANAVRYVVQVFDFAADISSPYEPILSGAPSPLYEATRKSTDLFVGLVDANVDTLTLDFNNLTSNYPVNVLQWKPTEFNAGVHIVRIAALDAQDRMIGFSYGDPDIRKAWVKRQAGVWLNFDNIQNTLLLYYVGGAFVAPVPASGGGGGGGGGLG